VHPIRETDLGKAIRCIRRRLGLGQIALVIRLTGRPHAGEVSRWEAGQLVPTLKMLLRLLHLAETATEREPILEALRARGVEQLVSDLQASGLLSRTDHQTSIHPADRNCNPGAEVPHCPSGGGADTGPAGGDLRLSSDGCVASSSTLAGSALAGAGAGPAPPESEGA